MPLNTAGCVWKAFHNITVIEYCPNSVWQHSRSTILALRQRWLNVDNALGWPSASHC